MAISVLGYGMPASSGTPGVKIKFAADPLGNGGTQSVRFASGTGDYIVNINICNQDADDRYITIDDTTGGDSIRVLNDLMIPANTSYVWETVFLDAGAQLDFRFATSLDQFN